MVLLSMRSHAIAREAEDPTIAKPRSSTVNSYRPSARGQTISSHYERALMFRSDTGAKAWVVLP